MDFVNVKWVKSQQSNDMKVAQPNEQVADPTQVPIQEVPRTNDPELEEDRDLISAFVKRNPRLAQIPDSRGYGD